MKNQNIEPASFFKMMSLIYNALLAGMIIMGGIMYLMNPSKNLDFDLSNQLLAIMLVVMVTGVFGSNLGYNFLKNKIDNNDSIGEKIAKVQGATIAKLAFIEAPALLGIILYMVESNLAFLMLSAIMILYFLVLKPSKDKILDDMNLTSEERRKF
ncbi:hypothetical protein K0U91_07780 [Chryseobacterium chendengshani]|uniref:hypothetical protein n=1 Tax=Chryseobacterium sp. LJ668 TaxID=2864040 RepID=UPI001C690305|nr:hypothetical protein [Chryseobacterium sp. LJ668]MBW8522370.1 hypothetical protein [Chryseobacterium sp. LJ668]QYK18009.1 hypothetical protein K0U91_07780 [Chryseobacterium sp. LJ668]